MTAILFEITALFVLILINGLLSMSEIAVVSSRKVRLQQRATAGNNGAKAALDLAANPNHFLSTVQIGITLIGILAGAFGGATIAEELEAFFSTLPNAWLVTYSEGISVGLVVVVITYLSLILGELAPKRIGLNDPEGIASRFSPAMRSLSRLASPLVHLLALSTNLVLRLLGIQPSSEPEVTEEEIRLLIEQGTEGGIFEPAEEEMVEQVFRLADRPITAQMTPRMEIVWLDVEDSWEEIKTILLTARFSYYPVAKGSIDDLLGVIHAKDLLAQFIEGKSMSLEEKTSEPLFFPENMTILDALERLRENHSQIAFIIDEFGGIQGLTTLTDILEAIAGDFPDVVDASDPEIIARENGTYLLDGLLHIDDFKELFDFPDLPGEEENQYQTLGGFVMTVLGKVPSAGDHFDWQGLRLDVMDMDGLRVDKILATPLPKSTQNER